MNVRNLVLVVLTVIVFSPSAASAQAGRGCSLFKQCPGGYSCIPLRQVCHRDSGALANEACQAGYGCASGFSCEAGTQVCRGPGQVGDACHLTRPCGAGLNCEAVSQVCRAPGAVGDACHATRPCGNGLSCQPGVQQCYHAPRKAGEPCVAGYACGDGLYCQSFVHKCVAKSVNYNSNSMCSTLRVQATAEDARRANITMSFSAGSSGGAGAYVSYETGVVYGNQGQFGCFATACVGNQSNVSISNFANFGIYSRYEDFIDFSAVTNQSVDTPFVKLGFQTSQVYSAAAPQSPSQILRNRVVGTTSGLSFGVGLSPVTVGSALCYTARLDEGSPLNNFSNIENLLTGWGRLGYAPESKPQQLGGPAAASSPPSPVVNTDTGVSLQQGSTVALQSLNYPNLFVRHQNFFVNLTTVSSNLDREDSAFVVRAGLAGRGFSFESVNYPGHFLRHQGFRLKLARLESHPLFSNDATFNPRPGLADSRGLSLESVNYPGYFIRHANSELVLIKGNGNLFRMDATFIPVSRAPSTPTPPRIQ